MVHRSTEALILTFRTRRQNKQGEEGNYQNEILGPFRKQQQNLRTGLVLHEYRGVLKEY